MLDIMAKLEATKQVYIIGFDIPVSISKYAFACLERKRREFAEKLGIPEPQMEYEDTVMILTGDVDLEQLKKAVETRRNEGPQVP
jgi:hypothetical protein